MLANQAIHRIAVKAHQVCGFDAATMRSPECCDADLTGCLVKGFVEVADSCDSFRHGGETQIRGEVFQQDFFCFPDRDCSLNHVIQFPDIARPSVWPKSLKRIR